MLSILIKIIILFSFVFPQGVDYAGPDDPAGDIEAEREGYMNGNRVYLYYRNTTELSDWPKPNVSKWSTAFFSMGKSKGCVGSKDGE